MKYIYPAKFIKEDVGGYSVFFHDLQGCYTQGEDLQDAVKMAEDCLGLFILTAEEAGETLPRATSVENINYDKDKEFVSNITIDYEEYKKRVNTKPVRKTVYIPKELNDKAEAEGINFSQVLRNALKNELNHNKQA